MHVITTIIAVLKWLHEALYGRKFWSLIKWFEPRKVKLIRLDLVEDAIAKVKVIKERLQAAQRSTKIICKCMLARVGILRRGSSVPKGFTNKRSNEIQ